MTSSSTPFDPVVSENSLGPLGNPIGKDDGESEGVYPLIEHCGWLLKVFKSHLITDADRTRIDQLVALAVNASASDRVLLNEHTSWPAARVTSTSHMTYGVVIPAAPPPYWVNLQLNESQTKYKPLEIDWLASEPKKCERHNVPVPSFANRVKICADIVAVAELLERHNLVYGDWSYANALWSADKHAGYVIDLDGCAFGTRASLGTPNWDDPQATGKQTDTFSDRYGVSLLLARCLTGERDIRLAREALQKIAIEHDVTSLYDLVNSGVVTTERGNRPTVAKLLETLHAAEIGAQETVGVVPQETVGGVVGWVPIPKPRAQTAPEIKPPKPTTTPPSAPNLNPISGDPVRSELLTDFTKTMLVAIGMIALIILSSLVSGFVISIFFG